MKVLLVGKGAPERGGIAAFLDLLQRSDLARRHDLMFFNLARDVREGGGRLSGSNIMRTVTDAVDVWRRSAGVDVVHIHSALAPGVTLIRAGLLAAAARARRCRVVVHAHGGRIQLWLDSSRRSRIARLVLRPAHAVVAVSEGAEAALRGAGVAHVTRIDNAVDDQRFAPAAEARDSHPPVVLFVGILTARKGLLDLFAASDVLAQRGVDHRVVVIGGTPDEGAAAEAEVRAAAALRSSRVQLAGMRAPEDMPGVYATASLFCLPSWWEAMPLSILEAMAAGLPVVATDVGDVARLVEDGITGRVVPKGDVDALAAALVQVLENADQRRAMGAAAVARVAERWSIARLVREVDAVYRGDSRR